jgi:hypothetical protein
VLRLGGFTGPFSDFFSTAVAPAHCHHGRSGYKPFLLIPSPDGVVVCTANDNKKSSTTPPTVQKVAQRNKERGYLSGSGAFSEYLVGFTFFLNGDARYDSKPARL